MSIDWIKRVLVVGAGTMGHSIAMVFARGELDVDLVDVNEDILSRAMGLIRSNLQTLAQAGLIPCKAIPRAIKRIHPSTSLDVGERADFVVEAISEDRLAKKKLFHALDRICPPETIISSNTSYLDIFRLAKTSRPGKILIAHWYVPAHLIPLVDVVKGPGTSTETVETAKTLLLKLGKQPVVMKKFIPGYVVNRLQRAMAREIFHLMDKGYASPEEIDRAVKNSLGVRIPVLGVVQRYDFAGLDLALRFEQNPSIHLVSKNRSPRTLMHLVKRGHLGVKSGKGFYDYSSRKMRDILKERDTKMIHLLKFLEQE